MPDRRFAPITTEELQAKIVKLGKRGELGYQLVDHLAKDLKVSFDLENFCNDPCERMKLQGYHTLPNGLTCLGCTAGGDWEFPVFFIVYWDGKRLRGYVPTNGNPWNTTTRIAYGSNDVADGKNAQKRWPDLFDGRSLEISEFEFDEALIVADIQARILPISTEKKEKIVLQPHGHTNEEHAILARLCDAWNLFTKLPVAHPDDAREFCDHIHALQYIVALQLARRVEPGTWRVLGVDLAPKE